MTEIRRHIIFRKKIRSWIFVLNLTFHHKNQMVSPLMFLKAVGFWFLLLHFLVLFAYLLLLNAKISRVADCSCHLVFVVGTINLVP